LTRTKVRKHTKEKTPKRGLPWFAWLLIALGVAGIVVFIRIYPTDQSPPDHAGNATAAIIDQLSNLQENEDFVTEVTKELEDYGFEMNLYQGDEITVEFYRQLPTQGYKLIIFRAHSGLLVQNGEVIQRTVVFTNEEYGRSEHIREQLLGQLVMGTACEGCYPVMFGITPEFISTEILTGKITSMEGRFDDTVVIMMGCSGIVLPDLAKAFVDKGASVYLAWDDSVNLYYVDEATAYLMRQLCSGNLSIKEAVDSTMAAIGTDLEYGAELKYYPSSNGDKTLGELIK
jgi:hypothetical protein